MTAGLVSVGGIQIPASLQPPGMSIVIAALGLLISVHLFIVFGRETITPQSMVFYSLGVFLFSPSLMLGISRGHSIYEVRATTAAFLALFALSLILNRKPIKIKGLPQRIWAYRQVFLVTGLFFALLYSILFIYEKTMSSIWGWGLLGSGLIFVFLAQAAGHYKRQRLMLVFAGLSLGIILFWYTQRFRGFGRINIAALILAVLAIHSFFRPNQRWKKGIALLTPIGFIWGGAMGLFRSGVTELNFIDLAQGVFIDSVGIRSILAPFATWAALLKHLDNFGLFHWWEWGRQLAASFLFFVPRNWWHGKPEGFGRILVYELRPDLAHVGHSMAASIFGEGSAYFGWLGVPFAIFMFAVVANGFRHFLTRVQNRPVSISIPGIVGGAWAMAQIMSFAWVGFFTFAARVFPLFLGMLPLAALSVAVTAASSKTRLVRSKNFSGGKRKNHPSVRGMPSGMA